MPMLKKVWAAEERSKQEQATIAQLRKEKAEERAVEDSRRLQAAQGLVTSTPVERLEWMYAGQAMSEAVKQEQYLLGAAVKDTKAADSAAVSAAEASADERWKRGGASGGQGSAAVTSTGGGSGASLEAAARLREDPLVAILREQHRRAQHSASAAGNSAAALTTAATTPAASAAAVQHKPADRARRGDESGGSRSRRDGERAAGRAEAGRVEREVRRSRRHHRSHSSDSSRSGSSDGGGRSRKRRSRRRSRSRSGSRGRDSAASSRSTRSRDESSRRGRARDDEQGSAHYTRLEASGNAREAKNGRRVGELSSSSNAARGWQERQSRVCVEVTAANGSVSHQSCDSTVVPAASSTSASPSSAPAPPVVSAAFVSSTSAFGGRLGLIVPAGAPSPSLSAQQQYDTQPRQHAAEFRPATSAAAASSPTAAIPQPPARPSLSSLSEAERAERLRAMAADAESLLASRRQQAREAAQEVASLHDERGVDEMDRLSAPMLKQLHNAALARATPSQAQPIGVG